MHSFPVTFFRFKYKALVFLVILFFTADTVSVYQSGKVGFAAHIQRQAQAVCLYEAYLYAC